MKVLILLTVISATNGQMEENNKDVVCSESEDGYSVFVPHPTDCSLYYHCVGLTPVLMECPGNLLFDKNLNVCNWPEDAGCDLL